MRCDTIRCHATLEPLAHLIAAKLAGHPPTALARSSRHLEGAAGACGRALSGAQLVLPT